MSHDPRRSRPRYRDDQAARLCAPAAERNAAPIARALARLLAGGAPAQTPTPAPTPTPAQTPAQTPAPAPNAGTVIEIGAGTGQHAVACAAALPHLVWRPTDPDPLHLGSIDAWAAEAALPNLRRALRIDAAADWGGDPALADARPARAVFSANVIHIAPWAVARGIVAGAGASLAPGGALLLYGPFLDHGATTPGNREFDAMLRGRNPDWGLRDIAELTALAATAGLAAPDRVAMPANNLILAFRKT